MTHREWLIGVAQLAQLLCEGLSDEGDESTPSLTLKHLTTEMNAPWHYVRIEVDGRIDLEGVKKIENEFRKFCSTSGGSYESIRLVGSPECNFVVIVRLIFVE